MYVQETIIERIQTDLLDLEVELEVACHLLTRHIMFSEIQFCLLDSWKNLWIG